MWGTHAQLSESNPVRRFIPTYVGNAQVDWIMMPARTVHPHVCGERASTMTVDDMRIGSSPRMWGTLP